MGDENEEERPTCSVSFRLTPRQLRQLESLRSSLVGGVATISRSEVLRILLEHAVQGGEGSMRNVKELVMEPVVEFYALPMTKQVAVMLEGEPVAVLSEAQYEALKKRIKELKGVMRISKEEGAVG